MVGRRYGHSPDLDDWVQFVEDDTDYPQLDGDAFSEVPRLGRVATILENDIGDWSPSVEVGIQPGGSAVIEFMVTSDTPGYIEFDVHTEDLSRLNKVRFTTIPFQPPAPEGNGTGTEYPKVCENQNGLPLISTRAPEDGTDVLQVPGFPCRGAALVITHVDPNSDDDVDEFTVAARGISPT